MVFICHLNVPFMLMVQTAGLNRSDGKSNANHLTRIGSVRLEIALCTRVHGSEALRVENQKLRPCRGLCQRERFCISANERHCVFAAIGQHLVDGFGGGAVALGSTEGFGGEGIGASELGKRAAAEAVTKSEPMLR
jgi:hypothetical protein